ncbi:MAG: hypothetical protein IPL56_10895 [Saprospiraceae bacterium]|nr:hypothetical protein [Saprospiraceae bacterium]
MMKGRSSRIKLMMALAFSRRMLYIMLLRSTARLMSLSKDKTPKKENNKLNIRFLRRIILFDLIIFLKIDANVQKLVGR